MNKMKNGFTLIELVVVIVILGILATVAVPKFIDLTGDSRKAVMSSLAGSLKSVSTMIYTKAIIENQLTGSAVIETSGVFYAIFNGYPSTHNIGNGSGDSAANASGIMFSIDTDIPMIRVQQTTSGLKQTFFFYQNLGAACFITYNEAASSNEPPEITLDLDNC